MRFDSSMRDAWTLVDETWRFDLPEGWRQGRAIFGGLGAAAAAALAYRNLDGWQLRTTNVQFLRPSNPGPIDGHFLLHRQGKRTSFAQTTLVQGGDAFLVANHVFVRPRATGTRVDAPPASDLPAVDSLNELPYVPGVTPEFTQQIAMRWAEGGFPFSASDQARFAGFCRFRIPCGDAEAIVALLDAWPCPTLSMLKAPAAASSVMWTAHVLNVPDDCDDWFWFEYETVAGADGLHTAVGKLFAPNGQLAGYTEQLVAVFA